MVIYQLHEYGGEYEDTYDHIIGSYLRKERAEEEKAKAEAEEKKRREKSERCQNCLFLKDIAKDNFASLENLFNTVVDEFSDYCDEVELIEDDYGIDCENWEVSWDEPTFEIEEVEVEE
ncbi:MAG: hypothetical protein J6R59_10385 [Paludibacteraceae bacterium]|nr:hypothetical protein [Paludibacteraceae bacterium]